MDGQMEEHDFHGLRKNSTLHLILGGAAVHRCDNRLVLNAGFSCRGHAARVKALFPQPLPVVLQVFIDQVFGTAESGAHPGERKATKFSRHDA